ncbi:MAG: polymer-forming cytoskeletal protein [Melioribacteraceae bacterium]|nr:polymer-forming cytoskeletal protein [Melioribacteraceae bacterium]
MGSKSNLNTSHDISILSGGVKLEGKLYSDGNVRIDGKINGELVINGNLTLGETSIIKGNIKAVNITISGEVEGTVNSAEKLILESKSKLIGDLTAKVLVVEEGAKFDGKSFMGKKPEEEKVKNEE